MENHPCHHILIKDLSVLRFCVQRISLIVYVNFLRFSLKMSLFCKKMMCVS